MSFRVWLTRWRSYFSEMKVLRVAQKNLVCLLPERLQSPVFLRRHTSDFFVYREIFMGQPIYDFSLPFTPQLIIDCGGNIGLASIFFATKYPNARVICVEPDTSNYNMLARNIEPYKNIHGIHAGVWSKSTKLYITNPDVNAMSFRTNEVLPDTTINTSSCINAFDVMEIVKLGGGGYIGYI
jgi:FkbM family methyltransferase